MLMTILTSMSSSDSSITVKNEPSRMPANGQLKIIPCSRMSLLLTQVGKLLGEIISLIKVVQDTDVVVQNKLAFANA